MLNKALNAQSNKTLYYFKFYFASDRNIYLHKEDDILFLLGNSLS